LKEGEDFKNTKAFAAALEYTWYRLRSEAKTKKEVSGRYGIAVSTLTKYIATVEDYLS
jgi:hypothetical protein